MLLITRKHGKSVVIHTPAGPVVVQVLESVDRTCKLGVTAPLAVPIAREELLGFAARAEIEAAARVGHRAQIEGHPKEAGRETD